MFEEYDEIMTWALGKDWKATSIYTAYDRWNQNHPDLPKLMECTNEGSAAQASFITYQITKYFMDSK